MNELVIYQKHYDLILYSFPIINRFPRSQKFVLGQQIENCMVNISRMIIRANKKYNKKSTLYEIDILLEELRLLIRIAKDLHILSIKQYGIIAKKVNEIGRLLGGWIKSQQSR